MIFRQNYFKEIKNATLNVRRGVSVCSAVLYVQPRLCRGFKYNLMMAKKFLRFMAEKFYEN